MGFTTLDLGPKLRQITPKVTLMHKPLVLYTFFFVSKKQNSTLIDIMDHVSVSLLNIRRIIIFLAFVTQFI